METQDFKFSLYDYDIATANCVNISQVKSDFRISDDEDEDDSPKKFYTLTNFVVDSSIEVKPELNGQANESTDIPIAIIETQSKEYDELNGEGEFININVAKSANDKRYVVETYSNDLDLHSVDKRPVTPEFCEPAEAGAMDVDMEAQLRCKDCDFTTSSDMELKAHGKTHAAPAQFNCKICGQLFKHSYSVKRHMRIHTRDPAYKCNECSFECQRSESLKAHKKIHLESPTSHKCNVCTFTTSSKSSLKAHLDSHTKDPLKGEDCDLSATRLLLGLTSDSEDRPCNFNSISERFKCSECNYSTTKLVHLKMHMRKHSADVPFKCKLCDYTTAKKGNFVVHLRNHTGEKPYKCASCGFTCKQFIHLKRHIKNHVNEEELFGCSKCEYKTGEGRELELHIKSHGGTSEFVLDELHFDDESSDAHSNSSDAFLTEHSDTRRRSTKTKLHKCPHCEYMTNQTGNLKRHQKTHYKETPPSPVSAPVETPPSKLDVLECGECPYKATRKHQMDIHMRVHNGKQLYECNLCDYKSINKYNLSRHQKTHAFDEANGTIKEPESAG